MSTNIDAQKLIDEQTQASLEPRRPLRALVREARDLHKLERVGESESTPWLAILGLIPFLTTIFLVMAALAAAAYYLIP